MYLFITVTVYVVCVVSHMGKKCSTIELFGNGYDDNRIVKTKWEQKRNIRQLNMTTTQAQLAVTKGQL